MSGEWRELLYPLGFLSAIAFSARMLLQWISSEAKGKSYVMPLFWKLSLSGNLLLAIHAFIQVQFHVCLIQVCNAVISWRNLNLMQPPTERFSLRTTIGLMVLALLTTLLAFGLQGHFLLHDATEWFRIPVTPWQKNAHMQISTTWHVFGFVGLALFSSRFWLQWWCVERQQTSYLGPAFWWVSLAGESICLVYFLRIQDPVNFIGPAFALIPYIRNLMLLYKRNNLPKREVDL